MAWYLFDCVGSVFVVVCSISLRRFTTQPGVKGLFNRANILLGNWHRFWQPGRRQRRRRRAPKAMGMKAGPMVEPEAEPELRYEPS